VSRKVLRGASHELITISDLDLLNEPGLVAYEDGYADAREQGVSGYLIDASFTPEQRLRYQAGFTKGLRVYRVRLNESSQQISRTG
jgi:hypothetical protein